MFGQSRKYRKMAAESEARVRLELFRGKNVLRSWEAEGGDPTKAVWRALAAMHVMYVSAPKMFKPFIAPAPPKSLARLAGIYKKLGLDDLEKHGRIQDHGLWENHIFGDTYREITFEVRRWALSSGWRP